jgi:hypothetical protein
MVLCMHNVDLIDKSQFVIQFMTKLIQRTTLVLPEPLKTLAMRRSKKLGISLAKFVRQALEEALQKTASLEEKDSLLADSEVYRGAAPNDLSQNHDKYLY